MSLETECNDLWSKAPPIRKAFGEVQRFVAWLRSPQPGKEAQLRRILEGDPT